MKELRIPEGVTEIADHEFEYATALGSVVLPAGLKRIGNYAFRGSTLKEIHIPEGVEEIGDYAFSGTALGTFALDVQPGEKETRFGRSVFRYCRHLEKVSFRGITRVAPETFYDCVCLSSVSLPEELEEIGFRAFAGCLALKEFAFPAGLKSIGEGAFLGCDNLRHVFLPEGLLRIDRNGFFKCSFLRSVRVPESVRELGARAFAGSRGLTEITLSGRYEDLSVFARKDMWSGCSALEKIIAPHIPVGAFHRDWQQAAALGFADYYVSTETDDRKTADAYLEHFRREPQRYLPLLLHSKSLLQIFASRDMIPADAVEDLVNSAIERGDLETRTLLLDYQEKLLRTESKRENMAAKLTEMLDAL